ncbi:hypothetical protein EUX98_g7288 [Antrodiella citrinella]|uniref:Cytochrome P450 n=1 Tax=Antrodiella citrinella TaxID=2447956 RepID=A0A4S4MMG6_9APHY|nr:hypothetical protein EUX98_g7288 [Antrodiella citrinella]
MKDSVSFDEARWFLESNKLVFGPSVISITGDAHRKQRKMLNPAFSTDHMRLMTPMFYGISRKQLRDAVLFEVKDGPREVDMFHWMARTALELIGQGGLGCSLDPLAPGAESNPFGDALKAFMPLLHSVGTLRSFSHYLEYFGSLSFRRKLVDMSPHRDLRKLADAVDRLSFMSKDVLEKKKQALRDGGDALREQIGEGKDIMSILLKANMMSGVDDCLTEDEVTAQMATLVFAATDTTSTALVQILQSLAEHPEAQDELRTQIQSSAQGGDIPYDELMALPSTRETILPFFEPIRGKDGVLMKEVTVPKHTQLFIAVRALNRSMAIWGEDAHEWKPERWLSPLPKTVTQARIPGVYSNLMTFLGGGRSCIGFKFSQTEMKVILSTLLQDFKFSLPQNKNGVVWNSAGVIYPTVGKDSTQPSFPMTVERV